MFQTSMGGRSKEYLGSKYPPFNLWYPILNAVKEPACIAAATRNVLTNRIKQPRWIFREKSISRFVQFFSRWNMVHYTSRLNQWRCSVFCSGLHWKAADGWIFCAVESPWAFREIVIRAYERSHCGASSADVAQTQYGTFLGPKLLYVSSVESYFRNYVLHHGVVSGTQGVVHTLLCLEAWQTMMTFQAGLQRIPSQISN